MDLVALYEIAKHAATKAGEFIASQDNKSISVQSKEGGENLASQVVTEVDLQTEKIILDILKPTLREYDLGLLAEESNDDGSRFEKDYFWCVDPLDGTLAFSRDEEGYSTSIALVSKLGEAIIGAVCNPRTNSLYHALKGHGAFKNDSPIKIKEDSGDLTLFFDKSYQDHPQFETHIKAMNCQVILKPLGGAVMNGISTIEHAPGLYYKLPKKAQGGGSLWDFAASSIIHSEAGGFNSDYYGNPLDLNRKDSTFMNHRGIVYASSKELLKFLPK